MKKFIVVFACISIIFLALAAFIVIRSGRHASDSMSKDPTPSNNDSPVMVPITHSDPTEKIQGVSDDELETAENVSSNSISDSYGVTKLVFTGDVELSPPVQAKYDDSGVSGVVSDRLYNVLHDADITMINNEFCFSDRGEKNMEKQFTFRVSPSYVSLLTDMGVDIAGLANNHVLDYGKTALQDTFSTLENAGIAYTGAGNSLEEASKLIVMPCSDGRKLGFLAASHVIPSVDWNVTNSQPGEFCFYDEADLLRSIKTAKQEVDLLFVMVHWGVESTTDLTDYQVNDGHSFIDAGADAVIGMHSHCLQPVEIYQGKPVFYSLGNFIFNKSIGSGGGGCVEVTIPDNTAPSFRIIPTTAVNACTDIDDTGFSYVESISNGIFVDQDGNISERDM